MKNTIRVILTAFAALYAGALFAAPPTISWKICDMATGVIHTEPGPLHVDVPVQFPAAGSWIQVRASGQSDSGNLSNVVVWRDGVPLAWNNGYNGWWNNSDANWAYAGGSVGEIHVFAAQAFASDGTSSPKIYWITKTRDPNPAIVPKLTYQDLVTIAAFNPNGTQNPWFPNTGDFVTNSANLNQVIVSLKNNSSAGKVIEFTGDVYKFHLLKDDGARGYMNVFEQVQNLKLLGVSGTALNWAIRDYETGIARDPALGFSWAFTARWNNPYPYTTEPGSPDYTTAQDIAAGIPSPPPHSYSWAYNDQPHHFLAFDQACSGITIQGIRFTTDYTTRIGQDGSHIKLNGTHHRITQCTFEKSPGFAINIGAGAPASAQRFINVDACLFQNTYADGLHVDSCSESVWLVGNYFLNTRDDSISLTTVTDVYVWWNTIVNSKWRGILVWGGATEIDIWANHITGTASYGLQVGHDNMRPPTSDSTLPWSNSILIRENYFQQIGTQLGHDNPPEGYSPNVAMRLDRIHNLHIDAKPHAGITGNGFAVNNWGSGNYLNRTVNITNINQVSPSYLPSLYPHGLKNRNYLYVPTNGVAIDQNQPIGGVDDAGTPGGVAPQGGVIANLPTL